MTESENSELENHEAEYHEPPAFGQQLMLAREKAEMTIDEAARALNLSEEIVEAIEDSDLDRLPPVTFVQGYVRSYARLLELPEEKILAEFEEEVPHQIETDLQPRSPLPEQASSQTPVIKLISTMIMLSAVVILLYAVYSYYIEKSESIEKAGQAEYGDVAAQLPPEAPLIEQHARLGEDDVLVVDTPPGPDVEEAPLAGAATESTVTLQQEIEALTARDTADQATSETTASETAAGETTASEIIAEDIKPVPTVQPMTGGDILELSAEQESWAEIVDANEIRLFYGMIKPGQALSLTGQAPFDVFLGNAPVVSMSLNSTTIDMTKYIRSNNIAHFKISVEDGRARFQ
jgi:cytoskeleton protein RodZ